MNRDVVLPVLRQYQSVRVVVLPGLLVVCALHAITRLRPALVDDGLATTAAWLVTIATSALALVTAGSLVKEAAGNWFAQAVPLNSALFAPGLVLPVTLSLYGVASAPLGLPRAAAGALAVVASIAMLTAISRHVLRGRATLLYRCATHGHPQQMEELIADCREALLDPRLTVDRHSAIELLLAGEIADLAVLLDRYDDLAEAQEILVRWLPRGNHAGLVGAALSLTPALVLRSRWTGEVAGLEEGLDLVTRTIATVPSMLPAVRRLLLIPHSVGLVILAEQADADGDAATAERVNAAAVAELEDAVRLTSRWSSDRADLLIELASITATSSERDSLDAAIGRCRTALRSLRLRPLHAREVGCLLLVELLSRRAASDAKHPSPDLTEALRLCRHVADNGQRPHLALWGLPRLLQLSGADEAVIAAAFRRAFAVLSGVSFANAGTLAAEWAEWADRRHFTTEAAEAHLCWIRSLVTQSQRLRLRAERDRPTLEIQALTADAGFWLLAAGRPRDAALALELGCGAGLTERISRERGEVGERLAAAGREDLGERWLKVGERLASPTPAGRDRHRDESAVSTIRVGGQTFSSRFSARDGMPLADYERLVREISRVPGFEDVDATPTYEELREAAHDGPLVYVAATLEGGYAVVVTEEAFEPIAVTLPGLDDVDVEERVRLLLDADWSHVAADTLESTLEWLRVYLLKPLASALPVPALVTLVPVGALALLPIHAAGMQRARDASWRDRTGGLVFRYTPNARSLARAQATAREADDPQCAVLTVHAADTDAEQVLAALGGAKIWHIACRTDHDPLDPLSSRLQLADGPLSLRSMLAPERSVPRLALVSACTTAIGPEAELDELVGLAAALVQAGIAGVVCSHATTDGRASALLMLAFLKRFAEGAAPAEALVTAQTWLSGATNRELADAFGSLHALPDYLPEDGRQAWGRRREFADPHSWATFSYCGA
jgi:hypothetical protein